MAQYISTHYTTWMFKGRETQINENNKHLLGRMKTTFERHLIFKWEIPVGIMQSMNNITFTHSIMKDTFPASISPEKTFIH